MRFCLAFLIIALLSNIVTSENVVYEATYEQNVAVLNAVNCQNFFQSNKYVLTLFYQGACGKQCDETMVIFKDLAKSLKDKVILAKINILENEALADSYQVENELEMKLFVYNNPIDYDDLLETAKILDWVSQEISIWSNQINNSTQLTQYCEENSFVVLYLGDFSASNQQFQQYDAVTKVVDESYFAHSNEPSILKQYNVQNNKPKIVVFKHHDEKQAEFNGPSFQFLQIKRFVEFHQYPMVRDFNQRVAEELYGESKSAMLLFVNKTITNSELQRQADAAFRATAADLRNTNDYLIMSLVDANYGFGERMAQHLEVKSEDLPCVRITSVGEDEVLNYHYKGEFSSEGLKNFALGFRDGTLEPVYQTAEIPEENPGPVYEVVGKQFDQYVYDNSKDALVMFYAPWCSACKRFNEVMAKASQVLGPNFVFAQVDSTKNEIPGVLIDGFPMIKFWPAGSLKQPLDYKKPEAERTLTDLVDFLNTNAKGAKTEEL